MPVIRQTVAGANQFDGTPIGGFWGFVQFSKLPRTTGISIGLIAYTELMDAVALTTDVEVWAQLAGGAPTDRILLGTAQAGNALLNPITGNAEMRLCGLELPREPGEFTVGDPSLRGQFWDIKLATTNKTETATAVLQYRICPGPETSERDSAEV